MTGNTSSLQSQELKPHAHMVKSTMIQSLQRGLGILELIAKDGTGLTMAEVSRKIGLHTSTTFHLLRTLRSLGYLVQSETTREYRLGSKVFRLAASVLTEVQTLNISGPLLAEMAQQTGETSHLAIFEHGEVIVINKVDGSSPVRLTDRVGYPRPAHCTAIGKVLLAHLPEAELKTFLEEHELRPFTPKTITAVPVLEQELARVRGQGYAFDDEEHVQGIRCLAVPVRNFTGRVAAALGISGPVWRVSLDRVAQLTGLVTAMGRRLSQQLGYPGEASGNGDQAPKP